jgi:hypothetical protein
VTLEALGKRRAATAGWAHSGNKDNILQLHEIFGGSIVPSFMVHPLSKQLNWGLCKVLFFLGHVQVINEVNKFFTDGGTVDTFTTLVKLLIDSILSQVS